MEIIRGKQTSSMDMVGLAQRLNGYEAVHMDIGTGDGRFVRHLAHTCPRHLVIGIDACRENLYDASRRAPANALFIIANALALPSELSGLAAQVSINFPWGSLLDGLLAHDPALLESLLSVTRPGADLNIHLNGGALTSAGWSPEAGAERVRQVLAETGFRMRPPTMLLADDLRSLPTTWAKRLAFGREPYALRLRGSRNGAHTTGAMLSPRAAEMT